MLAKIANDNAGLLDKHGALAFFASKLAPTEGGRLATSGNASAECLIEMLNVSPYHLPSICI